VQRRAERQNLKGIRQGQPQACKLVVSEHYQSIYNFMVYLTGDASLAEDLTQETFISAWASASGYKGRASIRTWLHKIAYNKVIDSRRRLRRHDALLARLQQDGPNKSETSNPLQNLMVDEDSRFLYEAMLRLNSSEYLLIVLHYIQGMSFREIAKVLDERVGTVKWRTSHSLKKLRAFLTGRI